MIHKRKIEKLTVFFFGCWEGGGLEWDFLFIFFGGGFFF